MKTIILQLSTVVIPGVEGTVPAEEGAEADGAAGVGGGCDLLCLGAPPDEGVAVVDWLRELRN